MFEVWKGRKDIYNKFYFYFLKKKVGKRVDKNECRYYLFFMVYFLMKDKFVNVMSKYGVGWEEIGVCGRYDSGRYCI